MTDDNGLSWDDDDHLDFSDPGDASVLDAFDVYMPRAAPDDVDGGWDSTDPVANESDSRPHTLLFTVTNPPGTVSVTAAFDGQLHRVELSPKVVMMTELQLAEEITVLARLARQRARAGQHALIVEFMRRLGHDRVATRGFLEHDLGLPSPESAQLELAQVFATRYADHG